VNGMPEARQVNGMPEARQVNGMPEARQVNGMPEARQVKCVKELRGAERQAVGNTWGCGLAAPPLPSIAMR